MDALCMRCGKSDSSWNVHQAEFHVGSLQHWKLQLCNVCASVVASLVRAALQKPTGTGATSSAKAIG